MFDPQMTLHLRGNSAPHTEGLKDVMNSAMKYNLDPEYLSSQMLVLHRLPLGGDNVYDGCNRNTANTPQHLLEHAW